METKDEEEYVLIHLDMNCAFCGKPVYNGYFKKSEITYKDGKRILGKCYCKKHRDIDLVHDTNITAKLLG